MKKAICICCAAIMLFLTGCGSKKTDSEIIQEYLHDKYNKDFVVLNSIGSANGYTPFSYDLRATCAPVNDRSCMFIVNRSVKGSDNITMYDLYGQGILNKRAAESLEKKLAPYFEKLDITVDLESIGDIVLPDMDAITYDAYFSSIDPDYAEHPKKINQVLCTVGIDIDAKHPDSFEEEFDILFGALAELSKEIQVNAQMNVKMMHSDSFQIYQEWYMDHITTMPDRDGFDYDIYRFAYDVQNDEVGIPWASKEPFTKDDYVNKRTQNGN